MDIIDKVKQNIYDNELIHNKDIIVIGVSGGPDSVFLLHALSILKEVIKKEKDISYDLHIAHVNHMIRAEAKDDSVLVKKMSLKYNVPFHLLEIDVSEEAKKLKIGTEECGRNIRYEFFEQVKKQVGANLIAVAHNLEDNAETIIMNFIRGAGIRGLCGIDFKSNNIIRPILNISKQEIIEYLKENEIEYAIDKTNLTNDYTRNKIRNDLIKKIEKEYNPNFINSLNRMAIINKYDEEIIEQVIQEKYDNLNLIIEDNKIYLDRKVFCKNSQAIKYRIIRKILNELLGNLQGVEMVHIKDTCNLIDNGITKKQYVLGYKYKVVIENKNTAVFVKKM